MLSDDARWAAATAAATPFHAEVWADARAAGVRDSSVWDALAANAVRPGGPAPAFAEAFRRYFTGDYVFVEAFIDLLARTIASSTSFEHKKTLGGFLNLVLQGEASIFRASLKELWGVDADGIRNKVRAACSEQLRVGGELPPAFVVPHKMAAFLCRVAEEGDHLARVAVIAIAEGLYLHWGKRVTTEDVRSASGGEETGHTLGTTGEQRLYAQWCTLHSSAEFEGCVCAFVEAFNEAWAAAGEASRARCRVVIDEMLGNEVAFTSLLNEDT